MDELKKKRKITTIVYYIIAFVNGIDASCVTISMIYYLKDDVHIPNAKNMTSYIFGIFATSSSLIGIFAGRYIDRTRELKKTILFLIITTVVGNLIYTLGNIWLIIFGRVLCACVGAINGLLTGELSKCYDRHGFSSVVFIFQTCYSIGFIIGPATAGMFTGIRFSLGHWWKITANNFIGVFLAGIFIVLALAVLFLTSDVSKEYRKQKSINKVEEKTESSLQRNYKELSICDILRNYDLIVVFLLAASISCISAPNELIITMIGIFTFKFDLKTLSIITTIAVCMFVLTMLFVLRKLFSTPEKNVISYIICVFCISIACWFFMLPKLIVIENQIVRYIFIIVPIVLNAISGLSNFSLARQIIFRLVPENSVCFTEGVRIAFGKIFQVAVFVSSGYIFSNMVYVMPCVISIFLGILFLFFRNREVYNDLYPSLKKYEI